MKIHPNLHLAYCTNIHPGESWQETLYNLNQYTLKVREKVCSPDQPYGIGLRLSALAAKQLKEPSTMLDFQHWLERHHCYVFTINGFPYGNFHTTPVKDSVFAPDWQSQDRLEYTKLLFDILVQLLPNGIEGSVSTVPGSFKSFINHREQIDTIQDNLIACLQYMDQLSKRYGKKLHLGLEPEPLGLIESTSETLEFFDQIKALADPDLIHSFLGINYDTCHMAIQFEDAFSSLQTLTENSIKISKIHLSSALKVFPSSQGTDSLKPFLDTVYLHQVVGKSPSGERHYWKDLDVAMKNEDPWEEWRIHYHIPLHAHPQEGLYSTIDQLKLTMDFLEINPTICNHLEIETYTWQVLPFSIKSKEVGEQIYEEYLWCFEEFSKRGLYKKTSKNLVEIS